MAQHPKPFIAGSSVVSKPKAETVIKKNPKYGNVQSLVETGVSKTPKEDPLQHRRLKKLYSDEYFKKMKVSTFVAVILDYYKNSAGKKVIDECVNNGSEGEKECSRSDSDFSKLISGIGEMDVNKNDDDSQSRQKSDDLPVCLLLDVRSQEDFRKDHIITAKNYPHTMVTRAFNCETKDLVQYKYEQEKFILLYDENEELSQKVCNSLLQRGYETVYILCGGFSKAKEMFPNGLTVQTSKCNFLGLAPSAPSMEGDAQVPADLSPNEQEKVKNTVMSEEFHPDDIAVLQMKIDSYYGSKYKRSSETDKERLTRSDFENQEGYEGLTGDKITKQRSKTVPWK